MNCEENSSLADAQLRSGQKWLNRPEFHIPCMVLSTVIILLYILELRVVLYYRRSGPFASTYFRIWIMQAVADLLSLFCYIFFSFTRNIPKTWDFWVELNTTRVPQAIIILNGAVILSQITGVALTSTNRYLKVCKPTNNITTRFDNYSTGHYAIIVLIFPFLISALILAQTSPVFVYTVGHSSVIAPCFRKPGKVIYAIVAPLWCIFTLFLSTSYYTRIIKKLSSMSYMKRRALKTERTLTMLSIPVFVSLWLVFLYYSTIAAAIFVKWTAMYDLLFAYYHLLNLTLSIANPISALFSRDIRGRIFFQTIEFSNQRQTFLS